MIVVLPQGIVPVLKTGLRRLWSAATGRDAAPCVAAPALIEAPEGRRAGIGSDAPALNVADLACSYGSLKVLEGVAFKAMGSELLGIIGPNGAGKTTLMRCLSNGYERTGGTVAVFGQAIARNPPQSVVGFGIGRSFQTTSLFETLTVAECPRLARYRLDGTRVLSDAPTPRCRERPPRHHRDWPRPATGDRVQTFVPRHETRWNWRWCWRWSQRAAA